MQNEQPTTKCILHINGECHNTLKSDLLTNFNNVNDWIKIAKDVELTSEFTHFVLNPNAHTVGKTYLLLQIVKHGIHGLLDPELSGDNAHLCEVTRKEVLKWESLSEIDKFKMCNRYAICLNKPPSNIVKITIKLGRSVYDEISLASMNKQKINSNKNCPIKII